LVDDRQRLADSRRGNSPSSRGSRDDRVADASEEKEKRNEKVTETTS
jgi:hypothetical protein